MYRGCRGCTEDVLEDVGDVPRIYRGCISNYLGRNLPNAMFQVIQICGLSFEYIFHKVSSSVSS